MADPLLQFETDLRDKLKSESWFNTVNVVDYRSLVQSGYVAPGQDRNLMLALFEARGAKYGACAIVMPCTLSLPAPNAPGPEMQVRAEILVAESAMINASASGSTLTASQIALAILDHAHQWCIEGLGSVWAAAGAVQPNESLPNTLAYSVTLEARIPRDEFSQVAMPTISEIARTVSLACTTAGSTIYYTTNGTFPGVGNSAATAYTVPFAVAANTVVRAAAYKATLTGSDVIQATVT